MTRHWLAGAAAFALMTGVAFAQDRPSESSTTTRSTTTSTVPAIGKYNLSETHRETDRYGNAIRMKRTYKSSANGATVTSKTRTTTPDGSSRTTYREKETAPYGGGATVTSKTRTTTPDGAERTTYRERETPYSGSTTEKKTTTTIDR